MSSLVDEQLLAFGENFDGLDFSHAKKAGLTGYGVLVIASMVQAEAEVPGAFPPVAALIYNCLRAGMTLHIEPTMRYYLNDYTRPLVDSELQLDTPYNTCLRHGLPPTAISKSGLASMVAAANPGARLLPVLRRQAAHVRQARLRHDVRAVRSRCRGVQPGA